LKLNFDAYLANRNQKIWKEYKDVQDVRVNLLKENLTNIRMMKINSWTDIINARVN